MHDLDPQNGDIPPEHVDISGELPAALPVQQGARGIDMYERDLLETVSRFVEATGLGYHLGAAVERILHAPGEGREGGRSLREAMWLLERHIEIVERRPVGADLHMISERLAQSGDVIAELKALAGQLEPEPDTPAGVSSLPSSTLDDIIVMPVTATPADVFETASPPPAALDVSGPSVVEALAFEAEREQTLTGSAVPPLASEDEEENYPLRRELAVMAFRWVLMVVAVIAIVLVATLIAGWR